MISVCLASYNGEKYIKQQIETILCQISDYDELIISDDGSNDNTINIINSFNDKRIILLHSDFKTTSYNFLNAIKYAKGDYIFLSDQDDIWKPDKVSVILSYLLENDVVFHDGDVIDSNNKKIKSTLHTKAKIGFFYNLISNKTYTGCCMAFTKDLVNYITPFPPQEILHDRWIGSVANILKFKSIYIDNILISYRRHGKNVSNFGKSNISIFQRIFIRIIFINSICNRFFTKKNWRKRIFTNMLKNKNI